MMGRDAAFPPPSLPPSGGGNPTTDRRKILNLTYAGKKKNVKSGNTTGTERWKHLLKGIVARDFWPPVFFRNSTPSWPRNIRILNNANSASKIRRNMYWKRRHRRCCLSHRWCRISRVRNNARAVTYDQWWERYFDKVAAVLLLLVKA